MNHVAALVLVALALVLVVFRARTSHFECPNCGFSFKVSGLRFVLAPHAGSKRYVTCPNCHRGQMLAPVSDGDHPSPQ